MVARRHEARLRRQQHRDRRRHVVDRCAQRGAHRAHGADHPRPGLHPGQQADRLQPHPRREERAVPVGHPTGHRRGGLPVPGVVAAVRGVRLYRRRAHPAARERQCNPQDDQHPVTGHHSDADLYEAAAQLHAGGAVLGQGHRQPGAVAGRQTGRVPGAERHLPDADRAEPAAAHEGRILEVRPGVVTGRQTALVLQRPRRSPRDLGARSARRRRHPRRQSPERGSGVGHLVTGREVHRIPRPDRRGVHRRRHQWRHPARVPGHLRARAPDVVQRRQHHRHRRDQAIFRALSRGIERDPDDQPNDRPGGVSPGAAQPVVADAR